jgi:hypothetical protein
MAVAIHRSRSSGKLPAPRPALSAASLPKPVEIPAAGLPVEPEGELRLLRRAPAWRAPSAEALLALTLLLGLLLNLAAFLDPRLFSGLSGWGRERPALAESRAPRPPGWSELLLAGVPLLSGLALLGLGAVCRPEEDGPHGGA